MNALWKVSLILVLNWSLLNKGYTVINVLKASTLIVSLCSYAETFHIVGSPS
jgi:hypothetical protein